MSAFTTAKTVLTDLNAVRKALISMGWKENQIEVHDKPVALNGFHGTETPHKAELIIRKSNLGSYGAYNDLGFTRQADGTIQVIGEDAGEYGDIAGNKFKNTLAREYAYAKLQDEVEAAGFFIDSTERRNGKIYVTAENPYL